MVQSAPQGGSSLKRYRHGTHRCREPRETLDLLRPLLPGLGITRVANVTGLDRIGIPVVMVVRPNSRSLAVSQGKGPDLDSARVSGIMESLELYVAETAAPPVVTARWCDLVAEVGEGGAVDPDLLPGAGRAADRRRQTVAWVEGLDLFDGAPVRVPFELVHVDLAVPRPPGSGVFPVTSKGLASGNVVAEATLHALCEVAEGDALAAADRLDPLNRLLGRLRLETVDDPLCVELLATYEKADVAVAAWDVRAAAGLPVFLAAIIDRRSDPVLRPHPPAYGVGCHPDRGIALARALTEAAQSRLTAIAGSRDDAARWRYQLSQSRDFLDRHRRLADQPGYTDFASVPTTSSEFVEQDVDVVLSALRDRGATRSVLVDLSPPDLPVSVVRAVVAGLGTASDG